MKYPLGEHEKDNIRSKTGKKLDDITIEAVKNGQISAEDIKISADVLLRQAEVAEAAGKPQMRDNFVRASELVGVPDEVILNFYNKLRPNRSTKAELSDMAKELKSKYNADKCAALVLETISVYEKRGILL